MSTSTWATSGQPQSFADVVEIVLQEYERVQPIPVIVATIASVRDRLAGPAGAQGSDVPTASPTAVLIAARTALDALSPVP